eukprot:CAMPEP_0172505758 /NCGR_PEP_ID=MMETSP1066-20121228/188763_1 /TAXON_ID=671091 /ORGANISM="Coscinodiscus wailesii, Strain CCMP2513" /LENGTH=349 /DNA_ID=CAMNT_0013282491 /DNA_START=56 /DNA_END=1105 /DNA_ORIENTATION=-
MARMEGNIERSKALKRKNKKLFPACLVLLGVSVYVYIGFRMRQIHKKEKYKLITFVEKPKLPHGHSDIKNLPEHIFHSCPSSLSSKKKLSQSAAKKAVNGAYLQKKQEGIRPGFVYVMDAIMDTAKQQNQSVVMVQLGGMDGRDGDPLYKMAVKGKKSLEHWYPIVFEPVPHNFRKLKSTYESHSQERQLKCYALFNQLISYSHDESGGAFSQCSFCHFNHTSDDPKCQNWPDWKKQELGSIECERQWLQKCYVKDSLVCSTVGAAIKVLSILPSDVSVLQIDVEGYEAVVLTNYLNITSPSDYSPVIHFENKILIGRNQYEPVQSLLKSKGYELYESRTDTLALLVTP